MAIYMDGKEGRGLRMWNVCPSSSRRMETEDSERQWNGEKREGPNQAKLAGLKSNMKNLRGGEVYLPSVLFRPACP